MEISTPMMLQCLVNAAMLWLTYVLVALGLTLIFSMMEIVNFAHGDIYMLGGYAIFYLFGLYQINYFLALLLTMLLLALFGLVSERLFFRPVSGEFLPPVVISLGLGIILETSSLLIFGLDDKSVASPFQGVMQFLGVTLSMERLAVVPLALALIIGLFLFLQRVKLGRAMRAVAQDRVAAALQGIDINHTTAWGFAIGFALAGAAGALLTPIFFVNPSVGGSMVMKAFVMIVIGGMGSFIGAMIGALILALVDSFAATLLGGPAASLLIFLVFIMVLIVRPRGLMGHA